MLFLYGKNYFLSIDKHDFKKLDTEQILYFLRGYIELNSNIIVPINEDSHLKNINELYTEYPLCILYFRKIENIDNDLIDRVLKLLSDELKLSFKIENKFEIYNKIKYHYIIKLKNYNVLNFLSRIYPIDIDKNEVDEYTYSIYSSLTNYRYISYDIDNDTIQNHIPKCTIEYIHPAAIKPYKDYASDVGYKIFIIELYKMISNKIFIFNTGIKINPQFGYYYKLEPPSLLAQHGYILGSSINEDQKNKTLLITLIKVDKSLPDIKLPYHCSYLILKEFKHYEILNL